LSDPSTSRPWYARAFGARYRDVYAHRDDASARAEARFAFDALGGGADAAWLDVGCGAGRHAIALKERGARVVGLDYSPELLAAARARGLDRLLRADMRSLPFADAAFDAISFFFTSFGYFDDEENRAVLREARRASRPSGKLLLDLPDVFNLRATLKPFDVVESDAGTTTNRRALVGRRVEKQVLFSPKDGSPPLAYVESVRLYEPDELDALLAGVGFKTTRRFGSFDGREPGRGDRHIVVAEAKR
jgi:SAM-dependent methyltransferase